MNDNESETGLSIRPFTEALFIDELKDLSVDFSEIALDSLCDDNSSLREISLVKTLISMLKVGGTIQQKFEFKKQLVFLSQLQQGDVDATEIRRRNGKGIYVIGYFDAGNGLVFYDYFYIPSSDEAAAVGCAVIGIYALFSGAGFIGLASLPGLLPA